MKQVLFGKQSIPEKEGALEQRLEKHQEYLNKRQEMGIEAHKRNSDPYDTLD